MEHYLIVSSIMFFVGIYGFIARKNLLAVLISIELILNSVEINFSVFNRYLYPEHMEGLFFSLFGIAISAAETGGGHRHHHQRVPPGEQHRRPAYRQNEILGVWDIPYISFSSRW